MDINLHILILQEERIAVIINSRVNLPRITATCEFYAAATLLKTKLRHFMFHNEANISVNTIRLFQSAVSYLDSLATFQWQIYVRKYKIYLYMQLL